MIALLLLGVIIPHLPSNRYIKQIKHGLKHFQIKVKQDYDLRHPNRNKKTLEFDLICLFPSLGVTVTH